MCLVLLAWRTQPRHPLVLVANRDEFHARPAAPLAWWTDGAPLLAGRDLEAGGTWLGLDRRGRLALVTNYRDPSLPKPGGRTRGDLVPGFLRSDQSAEQCVRDAARAAGDYAGFSLLAMDAAGLGYAVNQPRADWSMLKPGVYGLSNRRLDEAWPKLVRTRAAFERELAAGRPDAARLAAIVSDRAIAEDADLPDTGVGIDWERRLSAAFIVSPDYGTRCTTVVTADDDGVVAVEERSHAPDGATTGRVRIVFQAAA